MLRSSDMIFPRLNALSLRLVFNSLIIMFLLMFIDGGVTFLVQGSFEISFKGLFSIPVLGL